MEMEVGFGRPGRASINNNGGGVVDETRARKRGNGRGETSAEQEQEQEQTSRSSPERPAGRRQVRARVVVVISAAQ